MPSPEASELDLGGAYDLPVKAAKPEKKPVVNQDVLIANVVKKSLELSKKHTKQDDRIQREAESLFQTKRHHSHSHSQMVFGKPKTPKDHMRPQVKLEKKNKYAQQKKDVH